MVVDTRTISSKPAVARESWRVRLSPRVVALLRLVLAQGVAEKIGPGRTGEDAMKRPSAALAIVVAAVVLLLLSSYGAGSIASAELLTNGGFESDLAGWTRPSWMEGNAKIASGTATAHTGSKSLNFVGRGSGIYVNQEVATSPGQAINMSGWVNMVVRGSSTDGVIELVGSTSMGEP